MQAPSMSVVEDPQQLALAVRAIGIYTKRMKHEAFRRVLAKVESFQRLQLGTDVRDQPHDRLSFRPPTSADHLRRGAKRQRPRSQSLIGGHLDPLQSPQAEIPRQVLG